MTGSASEDPDQGPESAVFGWRLSPACGYRLVFCCPVMESQFIDEGFVRTDQITDLWSFLQTVSGDKYDEVCIVPRGVLALGGGGGKCVIFVKAV